MRTDFFRLCVADDSVKSLLTESGVLKVFPVGGVDMSINTPYVTYQIISGNPYNSLDERPSSDHVSIQIDVYSNSYSQTQEIAEAVRHAIELDMVVTGFNLDENDSETKSYRVSFDADSITGRS